MRVFVAVLIKRIVEGQTFVRAKRIPAEQSGGGAQGKNLFAPKDFIQIKYKILPAPPFGAVYQVHLPPCKQN